MTKCLLVQFSDQIRKQYKTHYSQRDIDTHIRENNGDDTIEAVSSSEVEGHACLSSISIKVTDFSILIVSTSLHDVRHLNHFQNTHLSPANILQPFIPFDLQND